MPALSTGGLLEKLQSRISNLNLQIPKLALRSNPHNTNKTNKSYTGGFSSGPPPHLVRPLLGLPFLRLGWLGFLLGLPKLPQQGLDGFKSRVDCAHPGALRVGVR